MKRKFIFFLLASLFIMACTKDKTGPGGNVYVEGRVYIELENETNLSAATELMNDLDRTDFRLIGFKYTTETTFDSLSFYFNIFDSISYLHLFDITFEPDSNLATFGNMGFENFSLTQLEDWESVLVNHDIIEVLDSKKYGYLTIPKGDEALWIEILNGTSEVKIADYQYIYEPWCQTGG